MAGQKRKLPAQPAAAAEFDDDDISVSDDEALEFDDDVISSDVDASDGDNDDMEGDEDGQEPQDHDGLAAGTLGTSDDDMLLTAQTTSDATVLQLEVREYEGLDLDMHPCK